LPISYSFANTKPQLYKIDLAIFAYITPDGLQAEQWPTLQPQQLPQAFTPPQQVKGSKLSPSINRLTRNQHYRLLLHWTWDQAITNQNQIIPIYSNNNNGLVFGNMNILRGRFFGVKFNLQLAVPINLLRKYTGNADLQNLQNIVNNYAYFNLQQSRRLRSKEFNYFDHPLFGIFLYITPVKIASSVD